MAEIDLAQLARDWITLWQTELAGWLTDRETGERLDAWFGTHPARPAAPGAAPDAGHAAVGDLAGRVAALERELAALRRGDPGGG